MARVMAQEGGRASAVTVARSDGYALATCKAAYDGSGRLRVRLEAWLCHCPARCARKCRKKECPAGGLGGSGGSGVVDLRDLRPGVRAVFGKCPGRVSCF